MIDQDKPVIFMDAKCIKALEEIMRRHKERNREAAP